MSEKVNVDAWAMSDALERIQRKLPSGYHVALLAIHPTSPKAHVFLTDDTMENVRRALTDLEAPDVQIIAPGPVSAQP